MKSLVNYFRNSLVAALLGGLALSAMAEQEKPGYRIWIERPWEFRYVLAIQSPDTYALRQRLGKKRLSDLRAGAVQAVEAIFPLTIDIVTDLEGYRGDDKAVGAVLIGFNEKGAVLSRYDWSHHLYGRLTRIRELVLTHGDGAQDLQFHLGYWYTGRSDEEFDYIPAICSLDDEDRRYKKGYFADSLDRVGNFGCREWGYYLQNPQIPYIDVTSYGSDKSTYIRPVTGWGRFDVPPKPVIGKHGDVWVCLHECPNGEEPGIIPNIKLWAARNGWPEPRAPKRQPMFPDREFKRGELLD